MTGGTGYVGSHTAVVLADAGLGVVLYDNLSNSKRSVSRRINDIANRKIPFFNGGVRDGATLEETLKEYAIDAVVHFASFKAVGESVQKLIDYFENNLGGAISLLKAMGNSVIKTLVFSSSATVYGEPQYLPLDEAHPTRATISTWSTMPRATFLRSNSSAIIRVGMRSTSAPAPGAACCKWSRPSSAPPVNAFPAVSRRGARATWRHVMQKPKRPTANSVGRPTGRSTRCVKARGDSRQNPSAQRGNEPGVRRTDASQYAPWRLLTVAMPSRRDKFFRCVCELGNFGIDFRGIGRRNARNLVNEAGKFDFSG